MSIQWNEGTMAWMKTIWTRRTRLSAASRKRNQERLLGELLEPRFAPAGLPITFTVPAEMANQDVHTVTPVPASYNTPEDTAVKLLFTVGPFADVDATPTTQFRAKLTAVGGDRFTIHAGVPGVRVTGSGTATVTFTGTQSALNAYFTNSASPTRISYTPAANFSGTRNLTLAFRDLGTKASASAPVRVVVTPVNDPPVVTVPSQFRVTLGQPGSLKWRLSPVPFSDVDSQTLTVTLAVTNGAGALTANAPGSLVVTGQGAATMTIAGPIRALNQYFQTAGRITYTATGSSSLPRTLTTTVSDGQLTSAPTATTILVAQPNPVGPPTIMTLGSVPGGQRGQWLVITYDQLVAATGAAPGSRRLEFILNSQTLGMLQVWTGSAWVAPPLIGRSLMAPGGKIGWLPPATGSGAVPAFLVSLWDGKLKSKNTCQVSVEVSGTFTATAALTPTFGTPTATANGFTVVITNYDSAYTWAGT
ncbi:MAG: Ig-like domain-containing protein, partial [Planctomycetota bacterium]